jgi:SAM-dependent methyltransferase
MAPDEGRRVQLSSTPFAEHAATAAEAAQARLLAALVCPLANGPVEIVPFETAGAAVLSGAIFDRAGRRVGAIDNFQVNFVRPGEGEPLHRLRRQLAAGALPRRIDSVAEWRRIAHDSPQIAYSAPAVFIESADLVAVEQPGAVIGFDAAGAVEAQLHAHPWSGIVELRYAGRALEVDLYHPHTSVPRPVRLELGARPERVEIVVTGRRNDCALAAQSLFGGFRQQTGRNVPLRHHKTPKVRGAPFTGPFERLLAGVPAEGLLLDLGGGNRQVDDARYINLDYSDYSEPDLIGDAAQLPLRDGAVDAVYSSGVFEHLRDPVRAGAEVARVLKPGGRAAIDWAFMQPIHAEGLHFYNATPWGVETALSGLKLRNIWYSTSFAFLVRWGASVSDLVGRVPAEEIETVCAILSRWDQLIPESHKSYMANSVWAEFEKA